MSGLRSTTDFGVVDDEDRGAGIRRRLDAIGISDREWHTRTGIDRKTLHRAIDNDEKVRPTTYQAIADWLDRIERENQGVPASDPQDDLIEVELSGNFGIRAVVRAPVRDRDELKEMVASLIREMRGDQQ